MYLVLVHRIKKMTTYSEAKVPKKLDKRLNKNSILNSSLQKYNRSYRLSLQSTIELPGGGVKRYVQYIFILKSLTLWYSILYHSSNSLGRYEKALQWTKGRLMQTASFSIPPSDRHFESSPKRHQNRNRTETNRSWGLGTNAFLHNRRMFGGCRSEFSEVLDKFVTYRKVAKVTTPRKERKTRQESNSVKGLLPKRAIKCHRC